MVSCRHEDFRSMPIRGVFKKTQRVIYLCPSCGMEVERNLKFRDFDGVEARDGFRKFSKDEREYVPRVVLRSLRGLGDQIYLRPFLREFARNFEVWIDSSFPEIFHDIEGVKCYRLGGGSDGNVESLFLKYHAESEKKHKLPYAPFEYSRKDFITYNMNDLKAGKTILESFNKFIVPEPFNFDLAVKDEWVESAKAQLSKGVHAGNYLIFKAPTIRKEWPCYSRSPNMAYYRPILEKARLHGYKIVSMAYLREDEEWFDGEFPDDLVDLKLHGYLDIGTIIGLFELSEGSITFPSFAIPLSLAIKKPIFLIYGGYVPHKHLIDKRLDISFVYACEPKPFCFCMDELHKCKKGIDESSISKKFEKFLLGR